MSSPPAPAAADHLPLLLFDGNCRLCRAQAENFRALARGRVTIRPLQQGLPNVPGLSRERVLREITLIDHGGRLYGGAESLVRLVNHGHPLLGKLLYPYYLPGLRQLIDHLYAWVARNRYRLFGGPPECGDGSCRLHTPPTDDRHRDSPPAR